MIRIRGWIRLMAFWRDGCGPIVEILNLRQMVHHPNRYPNRFEALEYQSFLSVNIRL
ncbi:MAG: hypothetical protein ACOC7K_00735 [bacterium]